MNSRTGKAYDTDLAVKAMLQEKGDNKVFFHDIVNAGKAGIKEDVKQINIRLDHVEARLDYYGLQIEQINKRLDYNNLKKLPKNY